MRKKSWYRVQDETKLFTPSLLLYPDHIRDNIRRMIHLAGNPERLRPHVKTHKTAEIIRLQLEMGIGKFKCATLSELLLLAENGAVDILLAYPLYGPALARFLEYRALYPDSRLSLTVDNLDQIRFFEHLPELQSPHQPSHALELFVDLDIGMQRTGIPPGKAMDLIRTIEKSRSLRFRGLHIYDGHIHQKDLKERTRALDQDFKAVYDLMEEMQSAGLESGELACGGTPTFPIHARYPERTLCPGTTLLWDAAYSEHFPDLDFLPAAALAGRVISRAEGTYCLDLGYKALASEMPHPRLQLLDQGSFEVISHSEEHLVIRLQDQGQELENGQLVYALPMHICPTMALHEKVYVVRDSALSGTWEVKARKRIYT